MQIDFYAILTNKSQDYLSKLKLDKTQIKNLVSYFNTKHPNKDINQSLNELEQLQPFAAGGNLWESGQEISEPTLLCMRWIAGIKFQEVLEVLKFDLQDPNVVQKLEEGNIGTAQRWAKTVTGSNLEDDSEMMCGRYAKPPRLATFPCDEQYGALHANNKAPITKRIDISSVCSHHFLPYGTLLNEGAYAIISYIPGDFVLGISKLQRVADWVCRRPTIQEDLTKDLWEAIAKAAKTEDVFVQISNARHTCEYLRGSQSHDGSFTTVHFGGKFQEKELRDSVIRSVQNN